MTKITKLFSGALLFACTIGMTLPATSARADVWYEEEGVWGAGGLLVGGTLGYLLGRENARRSYLVREVDAPYYGRPYYGGSYYDTAPRGYTVAHGYPVLTGQSTYKETRFWPFYRRVESYPIAATGVTLGAPQTVSLAGYRAVAESAPAPAPPPATEAPISISVGDNNGDVNITIEGREATVQAPDDAAVVAIPNRWDGKGSRVVNVPAKVVAPEEATAETPAAKE